MRYRIDRVYHHSQRLREAFPGIKGGNKTEGEAPTIDEAHTWIRERVKQAGKVGLRLRPLDFEVVDQFAQETP